jgi:phosphoglycerate kinase
MSIANKSSILDIDVSGKRVVIRVDFNVPIKDGKVTGEGRIKGTLPTLKYLLDKGARSIVMISHLGRPDGQANKKYTLGPVAPVVERLLGRPVTFLPECVGSKVEAACANPAPGSIFLLENLRFHIEEAHLFLYLRNVHVCILFSSKYTC